MEDADKWKKYNRAIMENTQGIAKHDLPKLMNELGLDFQAPTNVGLTGQTETKEDLSEDYELKMFLHGFINDLSEEAKDRCLIKLGLRPEHPKTDGK